MAKIISSIRRKEIKEVVLNTLKLFFERNKQIYLPIPIENIVKMYSNCRLITYTQHMNLSNFDYNQFILSAGSKDAYTDYCVSTDRYLIFYNDIDKNIMLSNRYRWNIAHELGHILLGHHKKYEKTKVFRSELSDFEYKELEAEADYFASYILAPYAAIYFLGINTLDEFKKICKISSKAADIRFIEYKKWYNHSKFKDEFDKEIAKIFVKERTCKICNNISCHNDIFCCVCGNKKFYIGKGHNIMIYTKIDIDDNGKAKICPICENEQLHLAEYCPVCGTYIVNKCTACGKIQEGYARYCGNCGEKTTFLQNGLLSEWDEENENTIPNSIQNSDDLPF